MRRASDSFLRLPEACCFGRTVRKRQPIASIEALRRPVRLRRPPNRRLACRTELARRRARQGHGLHEWTCKQALRIAARSAGLEATAGRIKVRDLWHSLFVRFGGSPAADGGRIFASPTCFQGRVPRSDAENGYCLIRPFGSCGAFDEFVDPPPFRVRGSSPPRPPDPAAFPPRTAAGCLVFQRRISGRAQRMRFFLELTVPFRCARVVRRPSGAFGRPAFEGAAGLIRSNSPANALTRSSVPSSQSKISRHSLNCAARFLSRARHEL